MLMISVAKMMEIGWIWEAWTLVWKTEVLNTPPDNVILSDFN